MKKVFLTIVVIITLLIAAFSATFVYLTLRNSNNTEETIIVKTSENGDELTAKYGKLELKVDSINPQEGTTLITSATSKDVSVSLLSKKGTTTCSYNLEVVEVGESFPFSDIANELTIKGTASDSSDMSKNISFNEISVNKALSQKILGSYEITNIAGGSETVQTWTIDALLYKLDTDQSALLNKNYSYDLKIVNIECNNE